MARFVCMKKTFDDGLLRAARKASGAKTDTETIRLGLEGLVRRAAVERLLRLRGSEPDARDVPRWRPTLPPIELPVNDVCCYSECWSRVPEPKSAGFMSTATAKSM